jgi:hypothetical protein
MVLGGTVATPSVKLANGNVTLSGNAHYDNGGTAVVFITGDLEVNGNVTVGSDSALVFIVKKNIIISPTVTKLDGIYFAEKEFHTGTAGPGLDQTRTIAGNGMWYVSASGRFFLERSPDSVTCIGTPAEKVIFEPKYLLRLMDLMGEFKYTWEEVAA